MTLDYKNENDEDESWPGCLFCKHYERQGKCSAFPNGIPFPISSGALAHLLPLPTLQDNEVIFELIESKDANSN